MLNNIVGALHKQARARIRQQARDAFSITVKMKIHDFRRANVRVNANEQQAVAIDIHNTENRRRCALRTTQG